MFIGQTGTIAGPFAVISVLDTTAFSVAMREEQSLVALLQRARPGDFAVVPPVVAEVEYGIERLPAGSRKRQLLEIQRDRYLEMLRLLRWTREASGTYGTIKASLEQRRSLIDDFNIAIAAIALAHDARVVTANRVHFSRVDGLHHAHWNDA